jgi:hypothetical protein
MSKTFQCYETQSSTDTGIARPWPKCGMMNPPGSITCRVTFSGSTPTACEGGDRTVTLVFNRPNVCSNAYSNPAVPIGIIWAGGFSANQYDTGSPIVGWDFGCSAVESNGGSCEYNKNNNTWTFAASAIGRVVNGSTHCDISVTIIGLG